MANAYSLRRDYGEPMQIYDFNLIGQALQYKQSRYDANAASIQNQIDEMANLQLAKGVDRDYLHNNLSSLMSEVNNFGTVDLSQNSISRSIQNHVKQAVDDKVIKAYKSTQQLQKTYDSISKIREEHPDQWSPQNEYDATQGIDSYLENTEVGAEYTGKEMTPYVDINGAIEERMKNLEKFLPQVTKRETMNGDYIYTFEKKEISAAKVRALAESTLTPQLQNQMRIDANYSMMNADRLDLEDDVSSYYDAQLGEVNEGISFIEGELPTMNKGGEEYESYQNTLDDLIEKRKNLIRGKNNIPKMTDEGVRTTIYKTDLLDNVERTYSGVLSSEQSVKVNSAVLAREIQLAKKEGRI